VLRVEAIKQIRRPRTATTVLVVAAVAATVCALVAAYRGGSPERIGDWGSVLPRSSGMALALVSLNALTLLAIPVIACVFAGDSIAGEAGWGSLRYLLARPAARWKLITAKVVVAGTLTTSTILISLVVALAVGLAIYGWHTLPVVDLQHSTAFNLSATVFATPQALLRTLLAVGIVLVSTAAVFSFSLLLSTITEYSFAAVAGGIGFVFISRALDNIPGLQSLSPWLPVTDAGTTAWSGLFDQPIQSGPIVHLIIVQAIYAAALLTAAFGCFLRTDILS
jgi:ABC-2 type transport system permease protein